MTEQPPWNREHLGRVVRTAWLDWVKEQTTLKIYSLVPWEELSEDMKEVDRRIGVAIAKICASPEILDLPKKLDADFQCAQRVRHTVDEMKVIIHDLREQLGDLQEKVIRERTALRITRD